MGTLSRRDHKKLILKYVLKRTTREKLLYFLLFNNKSNYINNRHETNQCDWKVVLN